jgi:hypothetical protein
MSERPSPKKRGSIPIGALGLLSTILFCVGLARSQGAFSVFMEGGLGFAGLIRENAGLRRMHLT